LNVTTDQVTVELDQPASSSNETGVKLKITFLGSQPDRLASALLTDDSAVVLARVGLAAVSSDAPISTAPAADNNNAPIIAGAIVGALALIGLLVGVSVFARRRASPEYDPQRAGASIQLEQMMLMNEHEDAAIIDSLGEELDEGALRDESPHAATNNYNPPRIDDDVL
jgi:hypothetical protein